MTTNSPTSAAVAEPVVPETAAGEMDSGKAVNGEKKTMNGNGAEPAGVVADEKNDIKSESVPASVTNDGDNDVDIDDDDPVEEPDDEDEEDKLFSTLEKEDEEEQLKHLNDDQPKDIQAAPTLLRAGIQKGEVQAEDSDESDIESQKKAVAAAAATAAKIAAVEAVARAEKEEKEAADAAAAAAATAADDKETPTEESHQHHIHQRANQLDYLLSKASEYSNFIAKDLEELQANMAEDASRTVSKLDKKSKKRKGETGKGGSSKKQKLSKSKAKLETAQAKDAKLRVGSKPIFVQPSNLAEDCQLKDYQLEGVRWLASLFENGVSGILADEMGLGKTIQCVALIAHLLTKNVAGPFLIVAPLATLPNWIREFEKWLPSHPVIRFHGSAQDRETMFAGPMNPRLKKNKDFPFIVTSYETAIRDKAKLQKLAEFTYIIVDEGHRLKNHRCCLIQSLKKIPAANRLLLTGTPIQNTLDELWSLLNFVNPAIFDDLSVFQSWFGFRDIGQKTHGATNEESILLEERKNQTVSKLHEILRPFLLRRIKTDVISELPPKKEVIVYSGVSKLQAGYAQLIDKGTLRDTLIAQGIEDGRTLSQNNKMMNHRKNINHPFLFGEPIDPATGIHLGTAHPQLLVRASGKFALLDRMLERLHRDGHQVLIFSQMTKVLNIMEDYLRFRQWNYCRIDGSTNIDERQRQMDEFNAEKTSGVDGTRNFGDDRCFVFLLSTRAGGLGINLTAADTCIIFDSDFNPFNDAQAQDRCHRMGQTLPVAVYRMLTVNSVDIDMMERQISKKKLERMTIAGGDFRKAGRRSRGEITFEQLQGLLASDVKDMNAKGGDVEDIKISDEEFELIMDRKKLFGTGPDAIPTEGKMYDVIDPTQGDLLGAMES